MVQFWLVPLGKYITPARILVLGYSSIILVGAVLLMLPLSTIDGKGASFLTALFTSTSALCVTGLIVVNTETYFSFFGKLVILVLIQIGGLGYITAYAFILFLLGRKLSIREMGTLKAGMNLPHFGRLRQIVFVALVVSLAFELLGTLILIVPFISAREGSYGIFDAIFHAISAFNNAGFSTFGDNIIRFSNNAFVVITICFLIIVGGIGFFVLLDIYECFFLRKRSSLTMHTKLALSTTGWLLLVGTILVAIMEWTNPRTLGGMPLPQKIMNAFASAVFPRTAGFNTIDFSLTSPMLIILTIFLMAVGASPGGTGGGFKTTSLALAMTSVFNLLRGRFSTSFFSRKVPARVLINAFCLILIWIFLIIISTLLISITDGFRLEDIFFEVTSALGTVGLSRGITAALSPFAKLILIFLMLFGRIGPLTVGSAALQHLGAKRLHYPEEEVLVG